MIAAGLAAAAGFISALVLLALIARGPASADRVVGLSGALGAVAITMAALAVASRRADMLDAAIALAIAALGCVLAAARAAARPEEGG